MQSRLLLNVIIGQSVSVLKLLARKNQALLFQRNALLVLDLCLDVINGIKDLNVKRNGLSRDGLNEDLHSAAHDPIGVILAIVEFLDTCCARVLRTILCSTVFQGGAGSEAISR